jgi:hypothetical protein
MADCLLGDRTGRAKYRGANALEGADAQQSVAVLSLRPSPGIVRLDRMDLDRTWRLVACNLS